MSVEAKEILKDKFWIVESNGERFGTLSVNEEKQYMLTNDEGTRFFPSVKKLKQTLNTEISFTTASEVEEVSDKIVHGYATSCTPYNPMYDVQKKLPLFTKVKNQKVYIVLVTLSLDLTKAGLKVFVQK